MSTRSSSEIAARPARWKGTLKNLALSGAVFVLCLALTEVVLRFLGYGNVEIYQADPVLYWRLKPNQTCYTKIDHKQVHVNSRGTRGREFRTRFASSHSATRGPLAGAFRRRRLIPRCSRNFSRKILGTQGALR